MGVDQTLLYPTWFAEGFFLVRDPDVAYALARAYNDWIADFCKAAPARLFAAAILPLQNMDFALEELARVARVPSVRAVFIRPIFLEDRYLNHPYYDPLWAELEQRGITAAVHATPGCGTRNGPRTVRFSRRSKTGLCSRRPAAAAGRLPAAAAAPASDDVHRRDAARSSAGADPGHLARQPHVRRLDPDRLHGHGALSGDEGGRRPRQGLLDAGGARKDGGLDPRHPAVAPLPRQHRARRDCGSTAMSCSASMPRSG